MGFMRSGMGFMGFSMRDVLNPKKGQGTRIQNLEAISRMKQ